MKLLIASLLAVSVFDVASAQESGYGEAEYWDSCAVCHGPEGKGDGPLGDELQTRPADLTRLTEKNGGEFPYYRVFAVIDGRYIVPGTAKGICRSGAASFLMTTSKSMGLNGGEIVTTERIHELAGYVQSLQR